MMLTTKGRYAVMAMVDIAANNNNMPVNLDKISERQGIAVNYLEQIFVKLRRSGLVDSVRGPGGGYILANAAKDITVASVIAAVDEPLKMTRCSLATEEHAGCIHNKTKCLTHDLWDGLSRHIHDYLSNLTIYDVYTKNGIS